jgi:hypothetical protein
MAYYTCPFSEITPVTRQLEMVSRFDVEATQCIAAQLFLALEHLHGFNICYRYAGGGRRREREEGGREEGGMREGGGRREDRRREDVGEAYTYT